MTVKELMQLKNEVAAAIKTETNINTYLQMAGTGATRVQYGEEFHGDERVISARKTIPFPQYYERITKLYALSELLNSALSRANVELDVGDLVRERENVKMLIRICESALDHSKPFRRVDTQSVAGGGVERITKRYEPFVTSGDLKARIRDLKRHARGLQTRIDAANTMVIDVNGVERDEAEDLLDQ
jgi:hypothetical protein